MARQRAELGNLLRAVVGTLSGRLGHFVPLTPQEGVDLITIKELMGHKDLRMLEKIYRHVNKCADHLRKGLNRATEHLNGNGCDEAQLSQT